MVLKCDSRLTLKLRSTSAGDRSSKVWPLTIPALLIRMVGRPSCVCSQFLAGEIIRSHSLCLCAQTRYSTYVFFYPLSCVSNSVNIPNIARIPLHDPLVRRRRSGVLQGRPDIKQSDPHPPRLKQPSDLLSKPLTAARDDHELFVPEHGPRGPEREIMVQKREEFEGEVS